MAMFAKVAGDIICLTLGVDRGIPPPRQWQSLAVSEDADCHALLYGPAHH
jgi:hypothetical protein